MVQQPPGPPPGGMQPPPPPPPPGPPGGPFQAPVARPKPQLDMSNLPIAEIVVVVCALILVIMSGIGWYKSNITGIKEGSYDIFMDYDEDTSLTDFYELGLGGGAMSVLAMVVGILLLVFALAMIANRYLNFIPVQLPTGLIYLGGVALILLFMVLGIFVKPGFSVGGIGIGDYWSEFTGEELGKAALSWAMWIVSLVFALGIGVGGVMKLNESK